MVTAMEQMERRIMSALKSPETRLDPGARKLEGEEEDKSDPDTARIEAGFLGYRRGKIPRRDGERRKFAAHGSLASECISRSPRD